MLRIAICDDDKLHIAHTKMLAEEYFAAQKHEISEFNSANELLFKMEGAGYIPDIALLDIQMPGIDGIKLANEINRTAPECSVIFISSYIFYAPDVYGTEHIYFVLKSQMDERLSAALDKAVARISKPKSFIAVKSGASVTRIPVESVLYLERALHKTRIVTAETGYMTTQSPSELLSSVPDTFIHCHQSYWVNVRNIESLEANEFKLCNGWTVPISRAQKTKSKELFFRALAEKSYLP